MRLRGAEVQYLSGTDDNQSDVRIQALRLGLASQETADLLADQIVATLEAARIKIDHFIRPNSSPLYVPIVQEALCNLYAQGKLITRKEPSPYCNNCLQHLYENYISGRCPHCGRPASGSGCDDCGLPNHCGDLLDAMCTRCGAPPSRKSFKRLYFPLSQYDQQLREYWRTAAMSPKLRSLCEQVLHTGLPDIAITHIDNWGISASVVGFEGQTIYTWFEEAARYLAYAAHLGQERDRFWKSEETSAVLCFGFDNSFYYAALVPALLRALDPGIRLPSALLVNEFYLLDGVKFSTSRRHAIWGKDLLRVVPSDVVRYYLAATYPEVERTSFSMADFVETVDKELLGLWQAWLNELAARLRRDFEGRTPGACDWTEEHRRFFDRLETLTQEAAQAYEAQSFSPQRAVRVLGELVREARLFAKSEESWCRVLERTGTRRTATALELLAAKLLAVLSAPILPEYAERLWRDLGYRTPLCANRWEDRLAQVPAGRTLSSLAAAPYFPSTRLLIEGSEGRWS